MTFIRWIMFNQIISLLVACICLSRSVATAFLAPPSTPISTHTKSSSLHASSTNEGFLQVSRPDGSEHKLSYRVAAPIVALHVFDWRLGAGFESVVEKLGVRKFHLYGQSYGGILAFEYMKSVATATTNNEDDAKCLSAILSSAPSNVAQTHSKDDGEELTDAELEALFQTNHQCRMPEMPPKLKEAYANAGTVWRGTDAIKDYVATPPAEGASRMPSSMIMRGEHDFVSEECIEPWKSVFNTKFLRYKTMKGCSHHGLFEDGATYGELIDSFCAEYD
ncbi:hypothetical protein QTG54_006971 [Skeletonema marinoi]|uniref:AB hydrolase-1 domain-containing protein n=1 Tax=Skeletonema marinoi TaxID=267567 RepID=A0AAD9DCE5_9STRA|nr:hypothetical protein QTG54_006971 [Skeletonema marinoi]